MITVNIYRTEGGIIYGFRADNHGKDIVCAAVSILTHNAVNSIETFTPCEFTLDIKENGGYMNLIINDLKNGHRNKEAELLLESMTLGLLGIQEQYGKHIVVNDRRCSNVKN